MKFRTPHVIVPIVLGFCALPFLVDPEQSYLVYLLFQAFTFVALAQAWNLVAGYTGQMSLGSNAFFGLGGYVAAILWLRGVTGFFSPWGMLLAGLVCAVFAVFIGTPLLSKLKGDYFALGTLGLGEILRTVCLQGGVFTGGAAGLMLPSSAYVSMRPYYFTALGLAAFATAAVFGIVRSPLGLALVAVREDETAAASNGVNVFLYKVLAFAVGAFVTGLCGSLQAYYIFHVHPLGFFGLNWTLYPILMCLLGGAGTVSGPVLGALILTGVFEMARAWLPEIHPIVSGLLVILVVLFLPRGMVRMNLRPRLRLRGLSTSMGLGPAPIRGSEK